MVVLFPPPLFGIRLLSESRITRITQMDAGNTDLTKFLRSVEESQSRMTPQLVSLVLTKQHMAT